MSANAIISSAPRDTSSTAAGVYDAAFVPSPLLGNRHFQTIWGPIFRAQLKLPLTRERWELPDGDFLDVDRLSGRPEAPRLVVLHGLEGSSAAGYAQGLLAEAAARGWSAVALNFRSCSGESNRLARSYHSGETGDLALTVAKLLAESPSTKLVLAGVSLGGNVLVKWLGEQGEALPGQVHAAAAISVPFDLAACADALDAAGFWAGIYRRRFLKSLLAKARDKSKRFPDALDARVLEGISRLTVFDDRVTAHVHGFAGATDYYTRSSSGPYISKVRVPLLLVSAEDDPFIPAASLPREAVAESKWARLEISPQGGHVGFVAGDLAAKVFWAEERAGRFLEDVLVESGDKASGAPT